MHALASSVARLISARVMSRSRLSRDSLAISFPFAPERTAPRRPSMSRGPDRRLLDAIRRAARRRARGPWPKRRSKTIAPLDPACRKHAVAVRIRLPAFATRQCPTPCLSRRGQTRHRRKSRTIISASRAVLVMSGTHETGRHRSCAEPEASCSTYHLHCGQ